MEHTYSYNAVGSLESAAYANGIVHNYTYNSRHQLTNLAIQDASNEVLNSLTYTLNALGHRTQIAEGVLIASGRTRNFTYDALNRLTQEQISGDPFGYDGSIDYTYDAVSNRLSRTSTVSGVSNENYTYDQNDRLDGDSYDLNGNTTFAIGITTGDIYDFRNRLIRRITPGGITIDLKYDAEGNRVAKAINGVETRYLVDTQSITGYAQVLEELRSDGSGGREVFRTYAIGHNQISQTQLMDDGFGGEEWVTSFYLLDAQASVWGLCDTEGEVTDLYFYDAFGIHINDWGNGTPNVYRYTGQQWDEDLGHYYLRARYYKPNRGRFWTMDPFEGFMTDPQSLHKYLYAHGNPVMFVDPSGNLTLVETQVKILTQVALTLAILHPLIPGAGVQMVQQGISPRDIPFIIREFETIRDKCGVFMCFEFAEEASKSLAKRGLKKDKDYSKIVYQSLPNQTRNDIIFLGDFNSGTIISRNGIHKGVILKKFELVADNFMTAAERIWKVSYSVVPRPGPSKSITILEADIIGVGTITYE